MQSKGEPIDLVAVIDMAFRNWLILFVVPILVGVVAFMAYPRATSFAGSATLSVFAQPTTRMIQEARAVAFEIAALPVKIDSDGSSLTVSAKATNSADLERTLQSAVSTFQGMKLYDVDRAASAAAQEDRIDAQLSILEKVVAQMLSQGPDTEAYSAQRSSFGESLLAITTKISDLRKQKFDIGIAKQRNLVIGSTVLSKVEPEGSRLPLVLAVFLTGASFFLIFVFLLAREVLRRRLA